MTQTLSIKSKKIYFVLLFIYFLISHFLVPTTKTNDLFIFYDWALFSSPYNRAIDISWDNNTKFLFRDFNKVGKHKINDFHSIYHLTQQKNIPHLKKYTKHLKSFCKCDDLKLVVLSGQEAEHIIFKQKLKPIKTFDLLK